MTYALASALEYAKDGYSVIPISWNGKMKKPLVRWEEWQGRRADEAQIQSWWKSFPKAGVGIVTGKISNLVVMDVDPKHGGTDEGFPSTDRVVATGGGGQHHYYRYVDGARNRTGDNGVDVRAEGGYVVAPPSRHESGGTYEWDLDDKPGAITVAETVALSPSKSEREKLNGHADGVNHAPLFTHEQPKTWLMDSATSGFKEGGRNDGVTRLAGYYAGLGVIEGLVLRHCLDANAESESPLGYDEVARTVRSICGKEARKREESTKQAIKSGEIEAPDDNEDIELIGFDNYALKHGGKEVQWLIPGFLTNATIGFIFGPPGSYKSWGELDLAVSIAQGTPYLGVATPDRTGKVIIFQQEDSHITTSERIATIWAGRVGLKKPKIVDGIFTWECHEEPSNILLYENRDFRLDAPNAMAKLDRMLTKHKPVAVFMDPFYSLVKIENNMEAAAPLMIELKKLRDKHNCTFMLVHHTSKSSRGTGNRDGLHGSNFLNAANESSLQLHNIEGLPSSIVVQRRSKDGGPKDPIRVDYDIFDGSSDDPGEWRFNTEVTGIDQAEMRSLINPDREFGDDEGKSKSSKWKPSKPDKPMNMVTSDPDIQRKKDSVAKIVATGKLGPLNFKNLDEPLRKVFDDMYDSGRIKLSPDGKTYHNVLTLTEASGI